jgi:hypothetical protein
MTRITHAMTQSAASPARRATRSLIAVAAAALTTLVACSPDDLLDVEDIDVARPGSVADSSALPAVLAGAVGDFANAYNGGGDFNQITLSGQLADELYNTETFPTRIEVDQRRQQVTNGSLQNLFYATHQARASADRASDLYTEFAANEVGHATALNLSALTYIWFAEHYCGSVPISRESSPGVFEFGQSLTTDQLLATAIRKADSALAIATSGTGAAATKTQQQQVARVIKARALLDQNKPAEAATAIGGAAGVPTTMAFTYTHSELTTRQNNGTWGVTVSVARFGVPDGEGTGGTTLKFLSEGDIAGSVKDPRIANVKRGGTGRGFDNSTLQWMQQKYPARATVVTVVDGVEARLIEAEAQLRIGNYGGAGGTLAILNALRSDAALATLRGYAGTLPVLAAAGTPAAQVDQLFKERAYWLFLTAHRLGDLRRLIKQYSRTADAVFPSGTYHKSGTYGSDVNSPVPQAEENNPNFVRSSCVLNTP